MSYDSDRNLDRMYERDLVRWRQRVRKAEDHLRKHSDERSRKKYAEALASEPKHEDYFPRSHDTGDGCIVVLIQGFLTIIVYGIAGIVIPVLGILGLIYLFTN